jgi:hypothetical protein
MYLRFSQRANADGTLVRYVALAHNRRVDGKVKPDVLMNLGRVDRLDVDGLLRLAASIRKHFGDGSGLTDSAEAGQATGGAAREGLGCAAGASRKPIAPGRGHCHHADLDESRGRHGCR